MRSGLLSPGDSVGPDAPPGPAAPPADPLLRYEHIGAGLREQIVGMLPAGWSFEGTRMLDFGCGTGRVMRHLADQAEIAEIWGCDIDPACIAWVTENLCPPFHALDSEEEPPLPFPDDHFDLCLASSVFTHISDSWSAWLLELRRVLKPDGLLVASFLSAGSAYRRQTGDDWDEDRVGMTVLYPWQSLGAGGPTVYHSTWWLRAHWGRAFEIVDLRPGADSEYGHGQGFALLRPRDVSLTRDDLERDQPDEPRELAARRHNWRQIRQQEGSLDRIRVSYERSLSWRLTRPLRALKRWASG